MHRALLRRFSAAVCACVVASAAGARLAGQQPAAPLPGPPGPAPLAESRGIEELLRDGTLALEREDPVQAWRVYRAVLGKSPELVDGWIGLGRTHLMLARPLTGAAYAQAALAAAEQRQDAMALTVRAQIRARRFDEAASTATAFVQKQATPEAELLAAQASALFRVQRIDDAARAYRCVLQLDPEHAEAHLRLGSGLTAPRTIAPDPALDRAVGELRHGRLEVGIQQLRAVLARDEQNPVAHRLLGEALFQRRMRASMASQDPAFHALEALTEDVPHADPTVALDFVPAYVALDGHRRRVVDRALTLFASRLPKLITLGGRHDLLLETERTTDADSRAALRGSRTFDGRVWDDVRGIGGLQAATGIEALDEAADAGFDTLVHEIAHQVHYYALAQRDRVRIRALYKSARDRGRCLDYYAATNEAEYFGQGVEAFASLGKRPGCETTHGHTRFELRRIDPELHEFIAGIVDRDPLRDATRREAILVAAIEVALRCGRPDDAVTAAEMLAPGKARDEWLQRTTGARSDASSH